MTDEPRWRRYLRFWRRNVEHDVDDELQFHLEQRVQQFMNAGASREEALVRARTQFGDTALVRSELIDIGERIGHHHDRAGAWDALRQDVGFALRSLRRSPDFSAAIVATLALGIGANAAMFSLADRLFLRAPVGVADPASLRRLYVHSNWSIGNVWEIRSVLGYPAFATIDSALASRAQLAAFTKSDSMSMVDRGIESTVRGSYATSKYFSVLGVHAAIGRFYSANEDAMGAGALVAVISDALWHSRFGRDSAVLGRAVVVARQRYTIVGVAPRGFTGSDLDATDIWLPLGSFPRGMIGSRPWFESWRSGSFLHVLTRVAPGTPGTSDAWISTVSTTVYRLGEKAGVSNRPDTNATIIPGPLLESLGPTLTPAPEVAIAERLVGVTIVVLLIACANVANLLLARALSRRREIAVRLALGISRRRLVVQLLTESTLLSIVAGVAAVVVAAWAGRALRVMVMPQTHFAGAVVSTRVALFTGAIALITGIAAGLAPAVQASRPDLTNALKTGAGEGGGRGIRLRSSLVVAQVALSVVLLVGAGLFVRSLSRVQAIDLGYDASRLIFATVDFIDPDPRAPTNDSHHTELSAGLVAAAERVRRLPGVEQTALASAPPLAGYAMVGLHFRDGTVPPRLDDRDPAVIWVSPSYFAATGVRLTRGRLLTDADIGGTPVMVVNETTARTYWPAADAIGQCIVFFAATSPCTTVVGITKDSHLDDVLEKPVAVMLLPLVRPAGTASPLNASYLIVRADPKQLTRVMGETRRELRRIFPQAELPFVASTMSRIEPQLRPWRLGASLFSAFGVLALLVAAIGVYSVIAYSVGQRAHEMSVRAALGADSTQIVRLVVGYGVRVIGVGVVLGLFAAIALGRLIASMLYGTSTHDPVVMLSVALILLIVALVASAAPAWRAMTADPAVALRAE
ncbi:MAG: ADOP family duplicated permease [bacterium]